MGQNEEMHSNIYEDGDICESEVTAYKEKIEKRKNDLDCICNELKMAATMNYHRKLSTVCEIATEYLTLHSEKLLGESNRTLLHVALGLNNVKAANVLIQYGTKELILTEMTGMKYGGMTALHLAVVNGQLEIVKTILEKLEETERKNLVNCQTYGFMYNETLEISSMPLGLCLWCGRVELYEGLIDAGAEVDAAENESGNTAIHSLVLYSKENPEMMAKMIDLVLTHDATRKWWCRKNGIPQERFKFGPMHWKRLRQHLLSKPNKDGYTPLSLAAAKGAPFLITYIHNIAQVNRYTLWTYGPSSASLYDLSETDPIVVDTGKPAVLDIIVYGRKDKDMLSVMSSEPINSLIKTKWRSHRIVYYLWLLYHLALMILFTWWIIKRPVQDIFKQDILNQTSADLSEKESLAVECVICISASVYLLAELLDIVSSLFAIVQYRLRRRSTGFYKAPLSVILHFDNFRVILIPFALSTMAASMLRHQSNENSDIAFCVALASGWYYMLSFLRTFKSISYYTVMVHKMVFSDIIHFGNVFIFILLGFAAGNMALFSTLPGEEVPDQVKSFDRSIYSLFRLVIGLEEWDIVDQARSPLTASLAFLTFVLLTTILLLNMLIASMTDTYAAIEDRESLRMKYLALTCLTIERRMMPFTRCRKWKASRYLENCFEKEHCAISITEVKSN